MNVALLELRGVSVRRRDRVGGRERTVLDGLDLRIGAGELHVVAGPSGAGKSTLLDAILGLVPATGEVQVRGLVMPPRARWRHLAWLGQDAGATLPPRWSARRAVADPLRVRGVGADEASRQAEAALASVGLQGEIVGARPHQLSGGEQQRVALARALTQGAEIFLLDEPSSALDDANATALAGLLRTLCATTRAALVVSHDARFGAALGAEVHHLEDGRWQRHEPASSWARREQDLWQELT